jgi:hemoglobin/transferrin/lactoferrin receptor protein
MHILAQLLRGCYSCLPAVFFLFSIPMFGEGAAEFVVSGRVLNGSSSAVSGAEISLLGPQQAVIAFARTDNGGHYQLQHVRPGRYVLRVWANPFAERRVAVDVHGDQVGLDFQMRLAPVAQEVTVTATVGQVESTSVVAQQVNVIGRDQIQLRAASVIAQAFREEEGIQLQRTSPTISGVFVRGLTGNKVNVFVDGVRYSTSAARGGISTFFNLMQPSNLDAIEVVRGPNSAQFGSDALGGSIQMLATTPPLGTDRPVFFGSYAADGDTADAGYGTNLMLSYGRRRWGITTNLAARRANTIRPGQGLDSHSAATRFFGQPSDVYYGSRLPDTAFTQYGGLFRMNFALTPNSQVLLHYERSEQDGGKRPDQLIGGDGNLVADLRNLMLDFFYVRYDQQKLGWLDRASLTYSLNSQREERVNQGGNGNPLGSITHEYERITVNGVQGNVAKQIARNDFLLGAEFYYERLHSPSYALNPSTNVSTTRRGRVPDQALFQSGGIFLQDNFEIIRDRLNWTGALRYGAASYRVNSADSPLVNGAPLWPSDSVRADAFTFRTGIIGHVTGAFSLSANVSHGFRVPHMTDLGTLGLTGAGFEVAAPDIAGMGGMVGDSALATAVSTGIPVSQVGPESSLSYEFTGRYRTRRVSESITFFVNDISDNITKQALILPAGAVGQSLGGQTITAQTPSGTVFVSASTAPVLVRANYDDARLYGFEHRGNILLTPHWQVGTVFTYVHAADRRTGFAPNIEGGTPAPQGYLSLHYSSPKGRWWLEPFVYAAYRQDRLSTLDLEDRRTGATRSRSNIQNFFRNGARVRGWVVPGPDGIFGNADDILSATGETLAQVQNRVLGLGVNSLPLYTTVPGFVTFNLRGGVTFGERQKLTATFENIGDRNYRGISSGVDAPGRSVSFRYTIGF